MGQQGVANDMYVVMYAFRNARTRDTIPYHMID